MEGDIYHKVDGQKTWKKIQAVLRTSGIYLRKGKVSSHHRHIMPMALTHPNNCIPQIAKSCHIQDYAISISPSMTSGYGMRLLQLHTVPD